MLSQIMIYSISGQDCDCQIYEAVIQKFYLVSHRSDLPY